MNPCWAYLHLTTDETLNSPRYEGEPEVAAAMRSKRSRHRNYLNQNLQYLRQSLIGRKAVRRIQAVLPPDSLPMHQNHVAIYAEQRMNVSTCVTRCHRLSSSCSPWSSSYSFYSSYAMLELHQRYSYSIQSNILSPKSQCHRAIPAAAPQRPHRSCPSRRATYRIVHLRMQGLLQFTQFQALQ